MTSWGKLGLFAGGVLFGTAGIGILKSSDMKKAYTQCTTAVLRGRDSIMQVGSTLKENCGDIKADAVDYASETDKKQVGIEIHSGRNRIVRRIFESLGYRVIKLDRVQFAGLTKKNVRRGDWRFLTEKEVDMLRMGAFE